MCDSATGCCHFYGNISDIELDSIFEILVKFCLNVTLRVIVSSASTNLGVNLHSFYRKNLFTNQCLQFFVVYFVKCLIANKLLSCQSRVTVTSCFVYKVIRGLKLIDCLRINPNQRIV